VSFFSEFGDEIFEAAADVVAHLADDFVGLACGI
jgi:hypothetical protein